MKSVASSVLISLAGLATPAYAQFGAIEQSDQDLKLAADSPYRDPDIIYLEADTLTNDEENNTLTAQGEVEGRYQDKTLRADSVIHYLETGKVIASGNVVLVQADGSSQYADKLELSNELEAGTATDFVARLPDGGVTAARFVARGENGEIELYNAYYTACEVCEEKPNPSWRIKARQVTQDKDSRTVQYRDATFELFGIPVFYTPYLAHPDPSADRASGILAPFFGYSNSTGFNARVPYYWAIDDYTEATITPRLYSKVNPLLEYEVARQFHTGRIELEGSLTYGSIFDRNGDIFDDASLFTDPDNAPVGKEARAHFNAKGLFAPTNFWTYGFGFQYTSDDNYLTRYSLNEQRETQGLYEGESRRNTSQAFIVGQDDSTRLTVSSVAFQDRRDRITDNGDGTFRFSETDDGQLPVIAPRIEVEHYISDPVLNGRLKASGNLTVLTRDTGSDYTRATASLDYGKTWIAPGGIEVKPFGNIRTDFYDIKPDDEIFPDTDDSQFNRTLGQVGVDIRYPFLKAGETVTWVLEPRVQVTQSFGDAKLNDFTESGAGDFILAEDAGNADLSAALLWQSNKSSGFDFWQEGTRLDVGGSVSADWGTRSSVNLFIGQSFSSGGDGLAIDGLSSEDGGFLLGSGLEGNQSDIVGEATVNLGRLFSTQTKLRYNEDSKELTRIDSTARLRTKWVEANARYFRLSNASGDLVDTLDAPQEEITGSARLHLTKNWSTTYALTRDLDSNTTRRQAFGLRYRDDCTLIELLYTKNRFNNDAILDNSGIGIRVSLLTLGDFGG
ncbi:MAG: LPS assembly protein LptD [Litorimonas sp.]